VAAARREDRVRARWVHMASGAFLARDGKQ
jgi:hypothetical protein